MPQMQNGLDYTKGFVGNCEVPRNYVLFGTSESAYVVRSAPSFLEKSAYGQSAWVHTPAPSRCMTLDTFLNPLCFSSLVSNIEITSLLRLLQGFELIHISCFKQHLLVVRATRVTTDDHTPADSEAGKSELWHHLHFVAIRDHPMLDCTHLPCSSLCLVTTLWGDCLLTFLLHLHSLFQKVRGYA